MPYTDRKQVETWLQDTPDVGSDGYDYASTIAEAIASAGHVIDNECDAPEGFYEPGGVEIVNEYHDGVELGCGVPVELRLRVLPLLSLTKVESCDSNGVWTTLTEGYANDYLQTGVGIRFLSNIPDYTYRNIRVTYKAGYVKTPSVISMFVAPKLAAAIIQFMLHKPQDPTANVAPISLQYSQVTQALLDEEMRQRLMMVKRVTPPSVV